MVVAELSTDEFQDVSAANQRGLTNVAVFMLNIAVVHTFGWIFANGKREPLTTAKAVFNNVGCDRLRDCCAAFNLVSLS